MASGYPAARLSTLGGLAAIVLWSSTIAVTRSLSEQLGPTTAGACVYLLGGCLLLLPWRKHAPGTGPASPSAWYVWGCGSLFVLYTVLLYFAIGLARDREQVLEIGIVNYLWPALTILFSVPLLQQRANAWLTLGILLALSGVVLVMSPGSRLPWSGLAERINHSPLPYALATIAAICWALYSNLTRRWTSPNAAGAVGWFVTATGLVLLLLRAFAPEPSLWTRQALVECALLGTMTALAYALWDRAMRQGDLLLVAACSYFTPLFSTLVSCVYLQVPVTSKLLLGSLLLVAGALLSWRSVQARPASAAKSVFASKGVLPISNS
jgi:drug/metabolite transporter (DMT)-like permease